jgi:CRISPR/Cas system-associated exonuclease Cas4 (RecB family)
MVGGHKPLAIAPDPDLQRRIRNWEEPGWLPISFTSLWRYEECPRQFWLAIQSGLRIGGDPADEGTEAHAVAESVQAGEEHLESGKLPLNAENYFDLKNKLVAAGRDEGALTELELFYEWDVKPGLRAQLRAFIDHAVVDRRGGRARIRDYKTGRVRKWDEHEVQRKTYSLVLVKQPEFGDIWEVEAQTNYLRWEEVGKGRVDIFDLGDLEEFALALEAKVRELAENLERAKAGDEDAFPPTPRLDNCRLCDFAHKCPAAQKLLSPYKLVLPVIHHYIKKRGSKEETLEVKEKPLEIMVPERVQTDADLAAMALAAWQLEAVLSGIKKVLDETGRLVEIPGTGYAYGPWITTTKKVRDIEGVIAYATEHELPINELVSFNGQQGKKYLDPLEHPFLAELAEEVPSRYPKREFRKLKPE